MQIYTVKPHVFLRKMDIIIVYRHKDSYVSCRNEKGNIIKLKVRMLNEEI